MAPLSVAGIRALRLILIQTITGKLRAEIGAAGGYHPDGPDELLYPVIFEHVAAGAGVQYGGNELPVGMERQRQHLNPRENENPPGLETRRAW